MSKQILDSNLIKYAEAVGDRMSKAYIEFGDYYPDQAWGCEGQIYPSLTGIAIMELYKVTKKELYKEGVQSIIESNIKKQMVSGGWPLLLGKTANGIRFEVTPEIMKITAAVEDLPPTVTALRLISDYQQYTGDKSYMESLKKGYHFLRCFWNESTGSFNEMLSGDALNLRASPRDYHIYALLCVQSLQKIFPEASQYVKPLYSSVKLNFEAMQADTYPLLYGMHAAIIAKIEGKSKYVTKVVRQRILDDIAVNSRFHIKGVPGAMGHRDGLRGICLDEGHLRNSIGAALAMSFYDLYVGTDEFTKSDLYANLTSWIQSMYNSDKYYEFVDFTTGEKLGFGSSGQYLPINWILGKF